MHVVAPKLVECHLGIQEFERIIKILPYSIMIELLELSLGIDASNSNSSSSSRRVNIQSDEDEESTNTVLTPNEVLATVLGKREDKKAKSMLANGDAIWADRVFAIIDKIAVPSDPLAESKQKFDALTSCLHLAYTLASTRSSGSDGYHNARVTAYGEFTKANDGTSSRKECRDTFNVFSKAFGGKRMGCGLHEAFKFIVYIVDQCNGIMDLKPDNLFLMFQLLITDLMLGLNYHDSVIQSACNGIGATIIICDGGGSYKKEYKNSGGKVVGPDYDKSNSTGADYVVGVYKSLININLYFDSKTLVDDVFQEIKRSSELGLLGVINLYIL